MWTEILKGTVPIVTVVVLAAAMALIPVPRAQADRVDDLRAQGQPAYCANWVNLAMFGLDNRLLWNSERRIDGPAELEPGKEYPGIIVVGWDKLTAQEQAFMNDAIFYGYDAAESFLRNGGAFAGSPYERQTWQYSFLGECLSRTEARSEAPTLRHAASSEALRDPAVLQQYACVNESLHAFRAAQRARIGMPKDTFWEENPLSEGWSDTLQESTRKLVDDAYAWSGPPQEFSQLVYRRCMRIR